MTDINILLVEDNPGDVVLTTTALQGMNIGHTIYTVGTGTEALDFLNREGEHADAPPVDLILMDINLPDTSGYNVISQLKDNWKFKSIPMIVLSGSKNEDDVKKSLESKADRYWVKPDDPSQHAELARKVEQFINDWFKPA